MFSFVPYNQKTEWVLPREEILGFGNTELNMVMDSNSWQKFRRTWLAETGNVNVFFSNPKNGT